MFGGGSVIPFSNGVVSTTPYGWSGSGLNAEFYTFLKNGTWSLVPFSSHMNIVGFKWVFKIKRKANGEIERYRLL